MEGVLWDVTPCSLVEIYRIYILLPSSGLKNVPSKREAKKATSFCLLGALFDPWKGSSVFLRNDSEFLPDFMASHERKLIWIAVICEGNLHHDLWEVRESVAFSWCFVQWNSTALRRLHLNWIPVGTGVYNGQVKTCFLNSRNWFMEIPRFLLCLLECAA